VRRVSANVAVIQICGCIITSTLVSVSSFTNKVLVRKGISSPSIMVACRHNANVKMDFTCTLTENATGSTPKDLVEMNFGAALEHHVS